MLIKNAKFQPNIFGDSSESERVIKLYALKDPDEKEVKNIKIKILKLF